MIRKALTGAAAVSLMIALLCVGAKAQTTAILQDPTIGFSAIQTDGLTFQITSCSFAAQGSGTAVACNPGAAGNLPEGDEIMAVVNNGGASIQVVNSTAGAPVMSIVSNGGTRFSSHNLDDLTLTFNITPTVAGSHTTISSVSASVSGSATQSGELADITAGMSVTAGSSIYPLNAAANGTTTGPITFPATNSLSVNYDLKLNASGIPGGDTITLTSVPTVYSPAPEPASLLILGPAALMLGSLRKRRRAAASGAV